MAKLICLYYIKKIPAEGANSLVMFHVIQRRLNPFNFNVWPHAKSETFILKLRCTINCIIINIYKVYK